MSETLIKVENVSKKFCRSLKRSLWYGMKDLGSELIGSHCGNEELRQDEFWAVKDVSFELKRGECLGLIGPNGAGKSSLLKMLNGLIKPDSGRIEMHGRVGALIELGAGFNPILTGRENIYVNGAVLGFTKEEVDRKFDDIVEFAEIVEFIDTPVQYYSSGMKVRLGFAVAVQMDPDILIIDEVLSVGDVGFRAKCFNAIYGMMQKAAVILVTHAMPQVSRICTNLIVIDFGKVCYHGKDVASGIDIYYNHFQPEEHSLVVGGSGKAIVNKIELRSGEKANINEVIFGEDLYVLIQFNVAKEIENPNICLTIVTQELQEIVQCSSFFNDIKIINSGCEMTLEIGLGKIYLNPSLYAICLTITTERHGEVVYKCQNLCNFRVTGKFIGHSPVQIIGEWNSKAIDRKSSSW
ncbi:MAG: ABC transporter ATP-binding protein [Pseudomonadota bacterium]